MSRICSAGAVVFLILSSVAASQAPSAGDALDKLLGDWQGVLSTPNGDLRLIATFKKGEDGVLAGEIESPDQAPGQKIPMSSVTAEDDRLSFAITALMVSFEGGWDEAEQAWSGKFTQGVTIPLVLKRKPSAEETPDGAPKPPESRR